MLPFQPLNIADQLEIRFSTTKHRSANLRIGGPAELSLLCGKTLTGNATKHFCRVNPNVMADACENGGHRETVWLCQTLSAPMSQRSFAATDLCRDQCHSGESGSQARRESMRVAIAPNRVTCQAIWFQSTSTINTIRSIASTCGTHEPICTP